jgi:hypothetical protein
VASDNDIDYRQLTRAELSQSLVNIDAQRFPENYRHLLAEIAFRDSGGGSEPPPEVPKRLSRLLKLHGDVAVSLLTKAVYGGLGTFYFALPLCIMWVLPKFIAAPEWGVGWAVAGTAIIWLFAALFLFGLCVTYRFESGVIKCLWFGRYILWKDSLDTLEDVASDFTKGLPTVYFVWPDHKRRLWIRVSDLDSSDVVV